MRKPNMRKLRKIAGRAKVLREVMLSMSAVTAPVFWQASDVRSTDVLASITAHVRLSSMYVKGADEKA